MASATSQPAKMAGAPSLLEDDFVPNATFAKRPARKDGYLIHDAVDFVFFTAKRDEKGRLLKPGRPTSLAGLAGTAKTSSVIARVKQLGARPVPRSLPTLEISDCYLPVPKKIQDADEVTQIRWMLEMHIHASFKPQYPGEEFVVIFDDFRRANPAVFAALFEITNEGTLTGIPLTGMVGVICIDNPVGEGYMNVRGGDYAFETRFAHYNVGADDTPWREHLASKFSDVDLKPIFNAFGKWDEAMKRTVSPRVIDHICQITQADLPPLLGLPIMPSGRVKVQDVGGNDRTREVLELFAATFAKPYRERIPEQLETALSAAIEHGWGVNIVGGPGLGKTATVKALPSKYEDLVLALYSGANMTMGDLVVQVPFDGKVISIVNERLTAKKGQRLLVAFDEAFRAPKNVKAQMLEVFQERAVGGVPIGGDGDVVGVWMLNNPAKTGNLVSNVGEVDEAFCSRFTLNIEVTDEDTKWREHLLAEYPEEAPPFLEWRAHSLKDDERDFVCPRVLEIMLEQYAFKGVNAIEHAIPVLHGKQLPIRLHELKARLAGRRVFGPKELFAEVDDIEARLNGAETDVKAHLDLQDEVVSVLRKADLAELTPHPEACARLAQALPTDIRISLIRTENPERQAFWTKVFKIFAPPLGRSTT